MNRQRLLDFLRDLAAHNTKDWFEAHRPQYHQARAAFEQLVADVIAALAAVEDLGGVPPKECMFRINRDVRFSKDKSPYHTAMTAAIGAGGRRGEGRSYFLRIAPGDSFIGSGIFEPDKATLDHIRQHLAQNADPLRAIVAAPAFQRYFGTIRGEALQTAPVGYDRAHPAIDLLRHKQFLAVHPLSNEDVVGDGLVAQIVAACAAMAPFLAYLEAASQPLHSA